jgi:hypothetical protein
VVDVGLNRHRIAAIAAFCGTLAAVPYLLAPLGSFGSVIFVYLAQLPLFAAGLWLGARAAALAGIAASVILLLTGNWLIAGAFAGLNAVPVVLLVREGLLARTDTAGAVEWYPAGLLTAWLTALGLAAIAVALALFGGLKGAESALRDALAPAFEVGFDENASCHALDLIAYILPGLLAASWMVMTATNATLAQGLLARFGANWRPSPDLASLSLPVWISVVLALAAGATVIGGTARFLAVNVMIALAVPFCLAGLAVIHVLARRLRRPAIPLVMFYVTAGLFGWPLLLVAVLGVLDSSLGLRRRLVQP